MLYKSYTFPIHLKLESLISSVQMLWQIIINQKYILSYVTALQPLPACKPVEKEQFYKKSLPCTYTHYAGRHAHMQARTYTRIQEVRKHWNDG